jgi:hypothetical protein
VQSLIGPRRKLSLQPAPLKQSFLQPLLRPRRQSTCVQFYLGLDARSHHPLPSISTTSIPYKLSMPAALPNAPRQKTSRRLRFKIHILRVINPSDSLTKPAGCRRLMGQYTTGPPLGVSPVLCAFPVLISHFMVQSGEGAERSVYLRLFEYS